MTIGGKESVKERVRLRRVGYAFDTFWQDVSFGVRMLVQRPGFTFLAASTLALGIGATTAVYAVVDSVLLSPVDWKVYTAVALMTLSVSRRCQKLTSRQRHWREKQLMH